VITEKLKLSGLNIITHKLGIIIVIKIKLVNRKYSSESPSAQSSFSYYLNIPYRGARVAWSVRRLSVCLWLRS